MSSIASISPASRGTRAQRDYDEPLFLVCTHGNHDKCCAKFGIPVYEKLQEASVGDQAWQCSHIGGDRFAGNLICLPARHSTTAMSHRADVPVIVDAYSRGEMFTSRSIAGAAAMREWFRSAEYFLRRHTGTACARQTSVTKADVKSDRVDRPFQRTSDGLHEIAFRGRSGTRRVTYLQIENAQLRLHNTN